MSRLWVSSTNSRSGRTAIVADEGESVWLYLIAAVASDAPPKPVADCWLCNTIDAPTTAEVQARRAEYREAGTPPPAPAEVMQSDSRHSKHIDERDVHFVWSDDGASVAAWIKGQLTGFIGDGERRGYNAYLVMACPWGQPIEMEHYRRLFEPST